jgi:hypothetical protein
MHRLPVARCLRRALRRRPPLKAANDATAAANASAPADTGHHELKEGIEAVDYRDKAKAANDPNLEADKKREEELKAAGG